MKENKTISAEDDLNKLESIVEKALWEFRAINAGVLPQQIVTHHTEYYYSIHEDRSNVDRWIEEQKLLERQKKRALYQGNISLLDNKRGELSASQNGEISLLNDNRNDKSLLTKIKQLYQAARQYLIPENILQK